MKLGRWLSDYYASPMELVMRALLPESVRQDAHSEKTQKVVILEKLPESSPYLKVTPVKFLSKT